MRSILAAVLLTVVAGLSHGQAVTPQLIASAPWGLLLSIGNWINADRDRVYFIQVEGHGDTADQAKLNGFRLAVEQAVGTIVLSETESRKQVLARDEIITYASGFVNRFKVNEVRRVGSGWRINMDVWVAESKLANRLLNDSMGRGTIDGARLATQVSTLQQERRDGDQLIRTIINDFPQRALDVQMDRSQAQFDNRRNLQIDVPVTVKWNADYLKALFDAYQMVGNGKAQYQNQPMLAINFRNPSWFGLNWNGEVFLQDPYKLQILLEHVTQNRPSIRLDIYDVNGAVMHTQCRPFVFSNLDPMENHLPSAYMLTVQQNRVSINQRYELEGKIRVNYRGNARIGSMDRVEVRMVTESQCPSLR
jgi:hypothetical protein